MKLGLALVTSASASPAGATSLGAVSSIRKAWRKNASSLSPQKLSAPSKSTARSTRCKFPLASLVETDDFVVRANGECVGETRTPDPLLRRQRATGCCQPRTVGNTLIRSFVAP